MRFLILISLVLFLLCSCKKDHFSLVSAEKRLTRHVWKMKTFIDIEENINYEPSEFNYNFKENGEYIVITDSLSYNGEWNLLDNDEYLKIGNNFFKIRILTNKLLGLESGQTTFYYIPVN